MPYISAILTAAGFGSRMNSPKPLLEWGDGTLIEHQIRALFAGGVSEVVVVLGHRADEISPRIFGTGARCVVNEQFADGRASSIRAGLSAISPDAEHALILGVDQPRTAEIVARVLKAHLSKDALITSPRIGGRGGHPLAFSIRLMPELMRISEQGQGLREVFERHRADINRVHIDDPMIRLDINTPEEYARARAMYERM